MVSTTENYDDTEEFWDVYEGFESRVALPHAIDQLIALPNDQMASSDYAFVIHLWSHEGLCLGELLRFERPVGGLAWLDGTLAVCTLDEVALFRNGVKFRAVEHNLGFASLNKFLPKLQSAWR